MTTDRGKTPAGVALGDCVRTARTSASLHQEELARLAGIGTSTLRQIESGTATGTSIFTIFRLLDASGTDLSALEPVFTTSTRG